MQKRRLPRPFPLLLTPRAGTLWSRGEPRAGAASPLRCTNYLRDRVYWGLDGVSGGWNNGMSYRGTFTVLPYKYPGLALLPNVMHPAPAPAWTYMYQMTPAARYSSHRPTVLLVVQHNQTDQCLFEVKSHNFGIWLTQSRRCFDELNTYFRLPSALGCPD